MVPDLVPGVTVNTEMALWRFSNDSNGLIFSGYSTKLNF